MQISVFVPQYGVIEAITPPFRTFNTANEFLTVFGKKPIFNVEYVGLNEYVPANNGEYWIWKKCTNEGGYRNETTYGIIYECPPSVLVVCPQGQDPLCN